MRDIIKIIVTILVGALAAAIPVTGFYFIWSWLVGLVPAAFAYAWAVKLAITVVMLVVGGWATIALAIALGALGAAMVAAITGLID